MRRTIIYTLFVLFGTVTTVAQNYEDVQCEDTCTHVHGIDMS